MPNSHVAWWDALYAVGRCQRCSAYDVIRADGITSHKCADGDEGDFDRLSGPTFEDDARCKVEAFRAAAARREAASAGINSDGKERA